jgi:phosphoglycolate phosphatase-like HAD superfamily hydrolase
MSDESLRILLWDIDGTLTRTARRGVFLDYTRPALERVFGTAGRLSELVVSGMTDWQIAAEALREDGVTREQISVRLIELSEHYVRELERITNGTPLYLALPGARETLAAIAANPRYRNSLLTGNVEAAAYLKLRLVGLAEFFQLPGAFGEDSFDRRELPAMAAKRICENLGVTLDSHQFIVIGDTPNDIACAKHFGARSVAVATGRTYSVEDLRVQEPDALLMDLLDTETVMRTLDNL